MNTGGSNDYIKHSTAKVPGCQHVVLTCFVLTPDSGAPCCCFGQTLSRKTDCIFMNYFLANGQKLGAQ